MPENQRFHVAVQFLAISFVIFAIHREDLKPAVPRGIAGNGSFRSRSILPDERPKPYRKEEMKRGMSLLAFANSSVAGSRGTVLKTFERIVTQSTQRLRVLPRSGREESRRKFLKLLQGRSQA